MLKLFNSLGKQLETFEPVNKENVTVFTCGPSVYQRSHIGNFRTFLFEDVLVRYLEYSGYRVKRGMNLTDVEDKAVREAQARKMGLHALAEENIHRFVEEMKLLRMKIPDYLPRASEAVDEAVEMIERLLNLKIAYWHQGNVYFDPLKFQGFGELYGLDMTRWPTKKRRFHKDTYPGIQWNLGDFILWHGYKEGDAIYWDTRIGRGRPSWNIQDPSMISKCFSETLSIYCGGYDNLFRHHDYSRAILESVRPYPMAKYWLHCYHLIVNGQKMSKSKGNIYYTDRLLECGYTIHEIRFFLIYGHYRKKLNYSDNTIGSAAEKLGKLRERVRAIHVVTKDHTDIDTGVSQKIRQIFADEMDNDLNIKTAFDALYKFLSKVDVENITPDTASGMIKALRKIDEVLQVIF